MAAAFTRWTPPLRRRPEHPLYVDHTIRADHAIPGVGCGSMGGMAQGSTVGLVIAGAGARGAYEMGALSVLLPWLHGRGEDPRIIVGTSAGAMNAVLVAAASDLADPEAAAGEGLDVWRSIARASVFNPLLPTGIASTLRYVGGLLGAPIRLEGLLDVRPLRRTLTEFGRWPVVHEAVASGRLDSIAVLATAMGAGGAAVRTDVFTQARGPLPPDDDRRGVRYVPVDLTPDHVLASAAIPVAFPPVRVDVQGRRGWYLDGGVRLNAPVKPALQLGADRLVVVATHPLDPGPEPPSDDTDDDAPDVFSAAAAVMTAALVDRMVDDVRSLQQVNRLLAAGARTQDYRHVPCLFVGPSRPEAIADAAREVLATKYKRPLAGDFAVLNRLVGGSQRAHAELLSFLLFDRDFVDVLVDLGRRDAAAALAVPDPWA
jgi:NTE family protein